MNEIKDIMQHKKSSGYLDDKEVGEILKKNIELNKLKRGEQLNEQERKRYETSENLWRDTLALEPKNPAANEDLSAFISNMNDVIDNIDIDMDPADLHRVVNDYVNQVKIMNMHSKGKLRHLEQLETKQDSEEYESPKHKKNSILK